MRQDLKQKDYQSLCRHGCHPDTVIRLNLALQRSSRGSLPIGKTITACLTIDLALVFQVRPSGGNQPPACLLATCNSLIAPLDLQLFSVSVVNSLVPSKIHAVFSVKPANGPPIH